MTKISIITPCFNEEENIAACITETRNVLSKLSGEYVYEHILSDNASTDSTTAKIKEFAENDPRIKLLVNSRNIGPFRNMWSALKHSSGDIIIPMLPADLQDPPEVIEKFVKEWEKGFLIVFGIRANRKDKFALKIARNFYYRILRKFAEDPMPLHAGEFLLCDRKVLKSIIDIDDEYPYIRGLIARTGVKSTTVSYTWAERKRGKTKNNFINLLDQAINGLVSTSRAPARIIWVSGMLISILSTVLPIILLLAIGITADKMEMNSLILANIVIFFLGIQMFFLGVIGEYVLSIHGQVRKIPNIFHTEKINFEEK
jgi:glycosyltransferase involved in cell wall biosynthesis